MTKAEDVSQQTPADPSLRIVCGCSRRGLLSTTALQAVTAVAVLGLVQPAQAQLSPSARPSGGQVAAGQASIAQSANKTTVTQTSRNAAVNWQSYNVGSAQTVQYVDPSPKSMTLNRVVGPNPSEIAGHIVSNGTVIIVNQAGLLFDKGAQINTAGLVVSAAGISNSNFMAGKLVFDQAAKPGAKVENRGTITIKDEGLAALVAPQVANSGVIRANLGKVILAGAEASVLDLYGDGMLSINVTKQVTTAPDGGAALVTNTGAISARGGTVVLTAQAVDGVVQTLVNAGGKISASSVGTRTGRVVIAGAGGDVIVSGTIAANGHAAGTTGGSVVVNTTGTVAVASTARISASGPAGGGTIAIGTTLKRAAGGPSVTGQKTAAAVTIASGATIAANATKSGNGGRVVVLSAQQTTMAGTITAKGGTEGGGGGFVEVSGQGGYALTGLIDVSAPHGALGTILLDPANLEIVASTSASGSLDLTLGNDNQVAYGDNPGGSDTVSNYEIQQLTGNILLQATNTLKLDANTPVSLHPDASLTLETQSGAITTGTLSPITASGSGAITILAGTIANSGGTISLGSNLITDPTAGAITVKADAGIYLNGVTLTTRTLDLATVSSGGVTQSAAGVINAGTLTSTGGIRGAVSLLGTSNAIANLRSLAVTGAGNGVAILDASALTVAGAVTAADNIYLRSSNTAGIAIAATGSVGAGATSKASFQADAFTIATGGKVTGGVFELAPVTAGKAIKLGTGGYLSSLTGIGPAEIRIGAVTLPGSSTATTTAGTITIGSSFGSAGADLELDSGGAIVQSSAAILTADTLTGTAATGVTLTENNAIAAVGSFTVGGGNFDLTDIGNLSVTGPLTATNITLTSPAIAVSGSIGATGGALTLAAGSGGIALNSGEILSGATVDLSATGGGVTQVAGGIIAAGLLQSSLGVTGSAGLQSTSNTIAAVGSFAVSSGDFTLVSTGLLTVAGPVASVSGDVVLRSTGPSSGITLTAAGSVAADTADATSTGTVSVRADSFLNGGAISGGTFELASDHIGNAMTIGGSAGVALTGITVNAFRFGSARGSITAGSIALGSDLVLNPLGNALDLEATGAVTDGGFKLQNVSILTGSAGSVSFTNAANTVGTIGAFSAGSFTLNDGSNLTVAGRVTASTAAAITDAGTLLVSGTIAPPSGTTAIAVGLTAGVLKLTGLVSDGGAGTVDITTLTGGLTQANTGTLIAGTLTSTGGIAGAALLPGSANKIGTIAALRANGTLKVVDNEALALSGLVSAGTAGTVDITTLTGGLTQGAGGTLIAGTLTSTGGIAGAALLRGVANAIATVDGFGATGSVSLTDATDLTIRNLLSAGAAGTIALGIHSLTLGDGVTPGEILVTAGGLRITADNVTLAQSGDAITASGQTVNITAGGTINEGGQGVISAGTLSGSAAGAATLDGPNLIRTVDGFGATGAVSLTDTADLIIRNLLSAGAAGTIALGTHNLTLGDGVTPGEILVTAGGLGITAGNVTLTQSGDAITASGQTVKITAKGTINEGGHGVITAGTLSGSANGTLAAASLTGANHIGTLASFTASTFLLDDATGLTIAGTVIAGAATVSALGSLLVAGSIGACGIAGDTTLISTGTLTVASTALIWSVGGTVDLEAGSGFVLSGGLINGQDVVVHAAAGAIVLNGGEVAAADSINVTASTGSLTEDGGIITANGPITLIGSSGLAIYAGTVIGAGAVHLEADGDVTISGGEVAAGSTLTIGGYSRSASDGNIVQTGGTLAAGVLLASLAGKNLTLTGGSRWALNLDAESTGTTDANLTGGAVTVTSGGTLVDCGNLCTGPAGAIPGPDPAQALSPGTLGSGLLRIIGGSIVIDQPEVADTIDLIANGNPGNITERAGGALSARILDGLAHGTVSLALTGVNAVKTIGSFSVASGGVPAGTFNLADTGTVSVTGPLSAGAVTLNAGSILVPGTIIGGTLIALYGTGGIAETGTIAPASGTTAIAVGLTAGVLNLTGLVSDGGAGTTSLVSTAGTIAETGTLIAGRLSGSATNGGAAADASLTGATATINQIATLASFSARNLILNDGPGLTVTGPVTTDNVTVTAGSIMVPGAIHGTTLVALYGTTGIAERDGGIIKAGTLALASNGNVTQTAGGTINAGTLISDGAINGGIIGGTIALLGTSNGIGTIGPLTAVSDIQILDTSALTVASNATVNSVTGNIYLESSNGAGIIFGTGGTLAVAAGKTIGLRTDAFTNLGTIGATGSVSASGGTVELAPYTPGSLVSLGTPGGLSLARLDGITASRLRLGAVTAPGATIAATRAGSIAIGGSFDATKINVLELDATGDVGQSAPLSAIVLTGSAGSFTLTNTLNSIGTIGLASGGPLGSLDATGTIIVNNGTNLTIAGFVQAGEDTTISLPGTLTLNGEVESPAGNTWLDVGTIVISQPGTVWPIVEALNVATLTATVLSQEAGVINAGTVTIAATGSAALDDGLIVATAGTVGITSPSVSVGNTETIAAVNSATAVSFSGDVTQADSYIGSNGNVHVGGTLTEQTKGTLLAIGNVSLGGLSQSGGTINAGNALSVGGGSGTAGWAGSVAKSGGFVQTGGVAAASGNVNIFTTGTFFQGAGGVLASGGTLGVTASNGITVGATVSAAGTPSGFMLLATAGDAVLATTGVLAGPPTIVHGNTISGNALQAPAGTVLIAGTAGTPAFGRAGTVGNAGSPSKGYTLGTSTGVTALTALSLGSAVTGGAVIPAVLIGGTVDIERPIAATTLGLYAETSVVEGAAGAIAAGTVTGSTGVSASGSLAAGLTALGWTNAGSAAIGWASGTTGSVTLTPGGTVNTIGTLSDFLVTGDFALTDGQDLRQIGSVLAGAGTLASGNTTTIDVTGTLTVDGLIATSAGDTYLSASGDLTIGTLGTVLANAGTVALSSGSAAAIALSGSVGAGTLIALSAGSGGIQQNGGTLSVATGTLSLASTGRVVQSAGTIIAGTLTSGGTISGSVDLTASNTIGTVGSFAATGDFDLLDNGTVTVAGPLRAANVTLSAGAIGITGRVVAGTLIALSAGAGGISETSGTLDVHAGTLSLASVGDVTQPGGAIIAGTLISGGPIGASVSLSASNTIAVLGSFAASGDFDLANNGSLGVGGPVNAANVTLSSGTIGLAGRVNASGLIGLSAGTGGIIETSGTLHAHTVSLAATGGGVHQTGGTIVASTLISGGTVTGSVDLTASNTIAAIGRFAASGDFGLTDTGTVGVNSTLEASNVILTAGSITVPGSITASQTLVSLLGTTGIDESGLVAASGGTVMLSTGATGAITLEGTVGAGSLVALSGGTGGIRQTAGTIDAHTGTLSVRDPGGAIVQTGGTIIAGTLIGGGIIRNGVSLIASNTIATIGSLKVASGNFVLADTGAVKVTGSLSADNVTLTAGSIDVAGTGTIDATSSRINLLGTSGITESGLLSATDVTLSTGSAGAIALSGRIDPETLTLSAGTGGISQTAGVLNAGAAGTLSLSTQGGGVSQSGGTIIAGTLLSDSGVTGTVSLLASNSIGAVGNLAVTSGDFTMVDASAVSLTGPLTANNVTITAPAITASGVIDAPGGAVSLNAASALAQISGVITGGNVSLRAPGATLSNGTIVATTGTVGISATTATVSAAEIIAALNTATGVVFSGSVTQAASSYIGSNGSVTVAGLLSENGGILLAAGNVALGSLAQTAGTIAAGTSLTIGSAGSPGSFKQSGGLLAATGNGDIVTAGAFTQTAGVLATGGTLGVTAGNGIDIAGAVSAAGPATGFTLLATGGDAVLETTGLLAGPALSVLGDSIPGNALLAPSGKVRIAGTSGTQGFGQAGAVGGIAAVSGYAVTRPASPPGALYLSVPAVAAPSATGVPVKLSGAAIDLQRPITASNLGLYAAGAITQEANAVITASRLTGSSGADVNLLQANVIGSLGAFADSGHAFHLVDSSNLMLAGLLTATSVWIQDVSHDIDVTTASAFAGLAAGSSNPLKTDPFPAAGSAGVYLEAANFAVLQNPSISTGWIVDWTFALTGSGNVDLGVFEQPRVKLFLSLATGTASGQVYVPGLQVTYTTATTKTVNLTGSVGNVSGQNAASGGHISPLPKNNYQINGCPISSVNCVKFTGLTLPVSNPLRDVDLGFMQYQGDADSVLPDVADRDY